MIPMCCGQVERDLRRQYGDRYRVISADSGASALEAVKQLKLRNEAVALFLVDQRMPHMSGVEFLEQAIQLYPDAKRALLTAYADTDAAIRAINNVQVDHWLMKPWDPPEERLYGVVDDMLDELAGFVINWQEFRRRESGGASMVAAFKWRIRGIFWGAISLPHRWLNVETDEAAKQLRWKLPTLNVLVCRWWFLRTGTILKNPPVGEVARKLGLRTRRRNFHFTRFGCGGRGIWRALAAAVYGAADYGFAHPVD